MTENRKVWVLFVKRWAFLAGALSLLGLLGLAAFAAMGRSALLPNSRERWSRAGASFHGAVGQGLPNGGEGSVKGCQTAGKGRSRAAKRRGAMVKGCQAVGKGGGFLWNAGKGGYGGGYKKRSRHGRRVLNAWFGAMQRGLCQPLGSVRSRFRDRCRTRRSYGGSCRYLLCWQHPDRLRLPGWQSARR